MIEKPTFDPDERMFTLSDVKRLYIAMRKKIYRWALIGGVLTFLFVGIQAPKYKIEASFKEGVEKPDAGGALKELLSGVSLASQQPQAASYMKSYQVLRPLVEKMGLNVGVPRTEWLLPKIFRRYRDNFKADWGHSLADPDPFVFQNVVYEEENGFSFGLRFTDKEHFIVQTGDQKTELAQGILGEAIDLPEHRVKFTVVKAPKTVKIDSFYPFSINHWLPAAKSLRGELKIVSNKSNQSIYELRIVSRDRHLGARILSELMSQYQSYLKREHDQLAKEQLSYLENKQSQVYCKLEDLFAENVNYLTKNLEEKGFLGLDQESKSLLIPYQNMYSKAFLIDLELARLAEIEKEGKTVPIADEGPLSAGINQILEKIQELKQQRDFLELSLCQSNGDSLELRKSELKELRDQRFAVEKLLREVDVGGEISSFDLNPGLCLWAKTLQDPDEREDLAEYLENYSRLLSLREKMLRERFFYGKNAPSELEGIDLPTATALFVEYNNKLDKAEASMKCYAEFKKEIHRPHFELASLSSILKDALSQKIIADAASLELRLKDEKYQSSKEERRNEEEMALHKKILSDHLDQLYKVEELNASLIREKMVGLQKVGLDGINQQISVLHEQASDAIKERRRMLISEKKLLEKKMGEVRSLATILPEKWRLERWLDLKTRMATEMIGKLTEVVESKTISNHLYHVGSKPLDYATVPSTPESPYLVRMTLLGGFVFAFAAFFASLMRQILRGFPVSLEKLQALRFPLLGSISSFCDGPAVGTPNGPDLELLRKLALFANGGKVIGLLSGRGPDYSYALGENLARMSTKAIILRCDFLSKFRKEDTPGLLQVWKGEIGELPIRKGKGFDYITAGGYSPFGTEIIQSESFYQLVEVLKKKYDWVFLLLRTPLSSAESAAGLRLCDKAVVTVSEEQTEELTPFTIWAYHEDRCRLTFVARS